MHHTTASFMKSVTACFVDKHTIIPRGSLDGDHPLARHGRGQQRDAAHSGQLVLRRAGTGISDASSSYNGHSIDAISRQF